jgi:hypothetical protein
MISAVSLRLLYLIFQRTLRLLLLLGRTSSTKDIELLVSRPDQGAFHRVVAGLAINPGRRCSIAGRRCSIDGGACRFGRICGEA